MIGAQKDFILVVDDDRHVRKSLATFIETHGYRTLSAQDGEEALELMSHHSVPVVLTDLRMPGLSGLDLIRKMRHLYPHSAIICITAFGHVKNAVEAMKEGVYDYLLKPLDLDELKMTIDKAMERQRLIEEVESLKEELKHRYSFENIIGHSGKMQEVFRTIEKVSSTDSNVLISGESGTGKELIARAIHFSSPRKDKPFVPVHCSSIPESLLESELFGHEKGSFTGAIQSKKGKFEMAEDGTIFLDDVGDILPGAQAKLLRVLQEREFMHLGGEENIKMRARIIAATNKKLDREIKEKNFREDLYYRLNVVSIVLPPLRERKEDIPFLAEHFIKKYSKKNNKPAKRLSAEAMHLFLSYSWPGNVREMENVIESAVVTGEDEIIRVKDLKTHLQPETINRKEDSNMGDLSLASNVEALEKHLIITTLKKAQGNCSHTAQLLGITYRSLRYKIKKYDLVEKLQELRSEKPLQEKDIRESSSLHPFRSKNGEG